MQETRDSIQKNTVIPYPIQKETKNHSQTIITSPRQSLEEIPLYTPKYDSVLLTSVSISTALLFVMIIYTQNSKDRTSLLSKYLNMGKHKDGQVFFEIFSMIQHFLSYLIYASLIYYLVKMNSPYSGWNIFGIASVALIGFAGIRTFLIAITGFFIRNTKIVIGHHGIARFFNKLFSLIFFPLVLMSLAYPKTGYSLVFIGSIILIITKIIFQLYFVYKLLKSIKFSKMHSFLYLCTLELLPFIYIAILIDFLMNNP